MAAASASGALYLLPTNEIAPVPIVPEAAATDPYAALMATYGARHCRHRREALEGWDDGLDPWHECDRGCTAALFAHEF